ncbi:MAG: IS1634 family transposase [Acidobacteria bacterium]|nr:IS1634 family transposase [Acidobacteriota bacterium]
MYLRPTTVRKNGRVYGYWKLVESYRTERGPRQRTVAYLGQMDEAGRLGIEQAADPEPASRQRQLFGEPDPEPRYVEIDRTRVRVENCRQFGGPWLALELVRELGLDEFLKRALPPGREQVPWSLTALILMISRFCEPSSELYIAEHFYRHSALSDLLGVSPARVDDNRLYRGLDELLPHKQALEVFLKERFGELFAIEYDLLLYDVTSTYFEGQALANPLAKRGYSRDHRSDCKQVCIGLVVTRCGLPLGYEVFAGNRHDSTTLEEIVETMEARYGTAQRIWVLDRGMVSEENIEFMKKGARQYIVGTPKSQLKRFERQLLDQEWHAIREGLEVKLCDCPDGGTETYILCRSRDRRQKEQAMHARFEKRIEEGLTKIAASGARQKQDVGTISRRVGRLLGKNSRAAGLFDVEVRTAENGAAQIAWKKVEKWRVWAELSDGAYALRSNVRDWTDEDLWRAYIQLTEAEAAFRIHKSDLSLRPVWHHKEERVLAHILVCFLAYVLWKFLGQLCRRAGLGDEPRRVLKELSELRAVDVVLFTRDGNDIHTRCVTQPSDHQKILLHRLGLELPRHLRMTQM